MMPTYTIVLIAAFPKKGSPMVGCSGASIPADSEYVPANSCSPCNILQSSRLSICELRSIIIFAVIEVGPWVLEEEEAEEEEEKGGGKSSSRNAER